jgi:hypothetical protein
MIHKILKLFAIGLAVSTQANALGHFCRIVVASSEFA